MSKSLCGTPSLKSVVLSCSKPPCYPAYPDFKTQAWDLFKGVAIPLWSLLVSADSHLLPVYPWSVLLWNTDQQLPTFLFTGFFYMLSNC
jgi:hypothetical protein